MNAIRGIGNSVQNKLVVRSHDQTIALLSWVPHPRGEAVPAEL